MARPRTHLLASLPLAYLVSHRWGWVGAAGVMAAGVLIDGDHLVDYAWTRLRGERSHFLVPLHGWELATALVLAASKARDKAKREATPGRWLGTEPDSFVAARQLAGLLTGASLGMWLHLILDVIGNKPEHPGVYSLAFRAFHGFRREMTGWSEETGFHFWSDLPWYRWWTAF